MRMRDYIVARGAASFLSDASEMYFSRLELQIKVDSVVLGHAKKIYRTSL
jgi:hypothetical protein